MDSAIYSVLQEKLGDATVKVGEEEFKLIDKVVDWEDGIAKLKATNEDIRKDRDSLKGTKAELEKRLTELDLAKSELAKKIEEIQSKGSKKGQEADELQKMVNTLKEQVELSTKQLQELAEKNKLAEETAKQSKLAAAHESMKNEILTELANNKIVGVQADVALNTIIAKGFAKVIDTDDGFKNSLSIVRDGKAFSCESIANLAKTFAEQNPFLISSSGKSGSGLPHDSNSANQPQGNKRNYFGMIQGE